MNGQYPDAVALQQTDTDGGTGGHTIHLTDEEIANLVSILVAAGVSSSYPDNPLRVIANGPWAWSLRAKLGWVAYPSHDSPQALVRRALRWQSEREEGLGHAFSWSSERRSNAPPG